MKDLITRAMTKDGLVNAVAISSTGIVERARQMHKMLPTATAALGRLLSAASMMGNMQKTEDGSITLQIKGGGPLGTLLAVSDAEGNVRGYVDHPQISLLEKYRGKLDVGAAVGADGMLTVIRDLRMKEPYVGTTVLQTSEIAEDLTYYFATSEQVPSAVGLGVLMSKDNTVKQAGGFIVQLMPFADEETIQALEDRISKITSVTDMLEKGMTPEDILKEVMGDMDVEFTDKIDTQFKCTCSKEKIVKALAGLSNKELDEIINDGKAIEVKCDFCNTTYKFSVEELKTLRKKY